MVATRSFREDSELLLRPSASAALILAFDSQRPNHAPSICSLVGVRRVLISRGADALDRTVLNGASVLDVHCDDEWMSSPHATLEVDSDGAWVLCDARSKNGTRVHGVPVYRHRLQDGDWIEMGSTFILYRASRPYDSRMPTELGYRDALADPFGTLSPSVAAALSPIRRLAPTQLPILIMGETGTGKEVAARAVHGLSGRPGDFVALNCAALPETLAESELFGHVRGAFSGAERDQLGLVRAADRGTLFLDEVGELSLALQAKLLRVLQEQEVTPVGATRPVRVDLRILSATNRRLDREVEAGRFRADLLARLSGYRLDLPRLRDRAEDFGLLLSRLLSRIGAGGTTLDRAVIRQLLAYDWPHNIRELEQVLRAAVALAGPGERIQLRHLPQAVLGFASMDPVRSRLEGLLKSHAGNVSAVARDMGKARVQIRRWCKRYGLDPFSYR
jgi:transcriptional regulator of acetoin/glycerol metabolism